MTRLSLRAHRARRASAAAPWAGHPAWDDLAADLPEEDFADDLRESLEAYRMGSKPRCEEREYLDLMEDAIARAGYRG